MIFPKLGICQVHSTQSPNVILFTSKGDSEIYCPKSGSTYAFPEASAIRNGQHFTWKMMKLFIFFLKWRFFCLPARWEFLDFLWTSRASFFFFLLLFSAPSSLGPAGPEQNGELASYSHRIASYRLSGSPRTWSAGTFRIYPHDPHDPHAGSWQRHLKNSAGWGDVCWARGFGEDRCLVVACAQCGHMWPRLFKAKRTSDLSRNPFTGKGVWFFWRLSLWPSGALVGCLAAPSATILKDKWEYVVLWHKSEVGTCA